jgi:lipopolysaccharide transport system permease protein
MQRAVERHGETRLHSLVAGAGAGLVEIVTRRYLVVRIAVAELRRDGAGLLLGEVWWIADPLIQMLIYTLLVGVIWVRPLPDYPLFVLAPLVAWKWLSATVIGASSAVTGNERLVRQVPFPRLVLPVARVMAETWRFGLGLLVLIALETVLWFDHLSWSLAWLPALLGVQLVLMLPVAIAASAATVFVRDVPNLARHVLRLGLYLSPVLYGMSQMSDRLPGPLAVLYALNPVTALLEGYRNVVFEGTPPNPVSLLMPLGVGLALIGPAIAWFRSLEPRFAKVL